MFGVSLNLITFKTTTFDITSNHKTMQTQQISERASQSLGQSNTDILVTEDKLEELLMVEKLIVRELLGEPNEPSGRNKRL